LLGLLHRRRRVSTGGYAHSFGLETYCQAGLVRGREDLERFLVAQIEGSAGPCDATAAVSALRAAVREDLQACREVDATLEAMKPVKEFREGSRQMGRQTLRVAAALTGEARLVRYAADVDKGLAPGHHVVAYGLASAALGWEPEAAATAYLTDHGAPDGAALRLLSMGQMECAARVGLSIRLSSAVREPRRATWAISELRARHEIAGIRTRARDEARS
jgi:urease accessory protein